MGARFDPEAGVLIVGKDCGSRAVAPAAAQGWIFGGFRTLWRIRDFQRSRDARPSTN